MSERPVLIWRGHGTDQSIHAAEIQKAGPDRSRQAIGSASRFGIAAARAPRSARDGYIAAWRGGDNDNRIWIRYGNAGWAGEQWTPPGDPRTEDRPALALYGDRNAMAWRGARGSGDDEHIWFATSDGWRSQTACDGIASSTHGPALATLRDGRLLMAWKGSGGNQHLYWSIFDGTAWTYPGEFVGGSTHGPALATVDNGDTIMAWKGAGNDDRIWSARYRDGSWGPQRLVVGRTTHGPALASVGVGVVMAWKAGGPGDERLFWSTDLKSQQAVAPEFTTADTPAVTFVDYLYL